MWYQGMQLRPVLRLPPQAKQPSEYQMRKTNYPSMSPPDKSSPWLKSHLYLPSPEQGLVQSHGRPDRLLVCKLNIGKPEDGHQEETIGTQSTMNSRAFRS